ncbi:MAG: Undecaprenyl-diphosphatase [Candidatus Peregrinibacteria bacterium GW2011_GWA2_44_7]|nr:MAG: Undecaprenyl-diphosphatase [Candidatus Peregrinibacteria bacterium GW2011_GWA2_44_7]
MTLLQALILGIVQGITEFLPISSDGHLVLFESFLGLKTEGLKAFDVVLHGGSLAAMVLYFRKDIWNLFQTTQRKMIGYIVLATLPAVVAGLTLEDWMDTTFRTTERTLGLIFLMGLFFFVAEGLAPRDKKATFTLKNTFMIGLAQAMALLPGISRSGSTIAAGLLFGIKREDAARFSFLLGMPAIGGAFVLKSWEAIQGEVLLPPANSVVMGFAASAIAGYISVSFLMKFLKTHSLRVFGVYLVVLSLVGMLGAVHIKEFVMANLQGVWI